MFKPELLAPAGNLAALRSALIGGADAVYFGLNVGFNARAKSSADLTLENLPEILNEIHACGAKAHITLNTLIFEDELSKIIAILKKVAEAGTDAIIVQDVGLAALAQHYVPQLTLHASTQMTVSSSLATDFARQLGISRVVLPRELALNEIEAIAKHTPLETEVFILGALCMSYSGQCLASLAWGGRSANRGQCAQACRLPYQAIIDGQVRKPQDHPAHLLSPRDQAGLTEVAELARIGVTSLKVEGRLKGPNYVYMACKAIRHRLDSDDIAKSCAYSDNLSDLRRDFTDLSLTFSRGFGHGFLRGIDHKDLVSKLPPQHHGVLLGTISSVKGRTITVPRPIDTERSQQLDYAADQQCLPVTPHKGMGVLIIPAQATVSFQNPNPGLGGPIFEVRKTARNYELTFGHIGPDLSRIQPGDRVYITSSPVLASDIKQALKGTPQGRIGLRLKVKGHLGEPLKVTAQTAAKTVTVSSVSALQPAERRSLDESALYEALAAWGGTPYYLEELDCAELTSGLFLRLSELKPLRREIYEKLQAAESGRALPASNDGSKNTSASPIVSAFRAVPAHKPLVMEHHALPHLIALCRTADQVKAALQCDVSEIELEYYPQNPQYATMEQLVHRSPETDLLLSTPRIHKDGEEHLLDRLAGQNSQAVMVRSLGALVYLANRLQRPQLDGDFSLNITNSVSARHFFTCGLNRLVISDDLDLKHTCQLAQALHKYKASSTSAATDKTPNHVNRLSHRLIAPLYRHIPAFHTQHCFFAEYLSEIEHPYPSHCGMPCKHHTIALQDRLGQVHPISADACCRNTVFDGLAKNVIEHLPVMWEAGLRQFRVEFLLESGAETRAIIARVQGELEKLSAK